MNSMTGFGRAKLEKENRQYVVEIRAVNHKYADITIKSPKTLLYLEEKIRKLISSKISRGKIDVFITYTNFGIEEKNVIINKQLAKTYIEQLKELAQETGINTELKVTEISKLPEVLNLKGSEEDSEYIWNELEECTQKAISNLIQMRNQEGIKIKEDLELRLENIEKNVNEISKSASGLVQEYIVKLEQRIKEILKTDSIDQTRLAQEVVIYSDKCSIEEEITRLKSHIIQFKNLIQESGSIGKKLDFLIQEMNRETNTIGSKSGKLEITNLVINLKTELEDIREQIQNIE